MKRISLLFLTALAACSGGGSSPLPSTPHTTPASGKVTMKLVIPNGAASTLAKATAKRDVALRPAFLSPSIASMKLWLATGSPGSWTPIAAYNGQSIGLTPATNPNCTSGSGGTACTIALSGIPYGEMGAVMSFFDGSGNFVGGSGYCSPPNDPGSTCPNGPTGGATYDGLANVTAGANIVEHFAIAGTVASLQFTQSNALWEGVSSSTSIGVQAKDPDGNIIIGNAPYTDAQGRALSLIVGSGVQTGAHDSYSTNITGCNDAQSSFIDAPGCSVSITYDGSQVLMPNQGTVQNGASATSGASPTQIVFTDNGIGQLASLFPVIFPGSTTPWYSVNSPVTGPFTDQLINAYDQIAESDTCNASNVGTSSFTQTAGTTPASLTINVQPSSASCVATYQISDGVGGWGFRGREQMVVTTGGAPAPLGYDIETPSIFFASASAGSQTIGLAQWDDSGVTSGPAGITFNWCVGPTLTANPANAGVTIATNSTATANVITVPMTSGTLTGSQTLSMTATPVGPGLCEFSAYAAGITPPPAGVDSDGNRYFTTVWF